MQNKAAGYRLRDRRKAGELLKETELSKGILKKGTELPVVTQGNHGVKLSELGISKRDSSKW